MKEIEILNVYDLNNTTPKYMKEEMTQLETTQTNLQF